MAMFDRLAARLRVLEGRILDGAVAMMRSATAPIRNRYHPERHYMRGPGPATARKAAMRAMTAHPLAETHGAI